MDQVIVVNTEDQIVGQTSRDEAHSQGLLHRASVVYVENSKGEIIVQKRVDGYLDHSAAGHVDVGESYEEAAMRELFEELGIQDIKLQYVGHGMTQQELKPRKGVSHMFEIFSCEADPKNLQTEEVKGVYWAKPQDVLADMKFGPEKYCDGFILSIDIYLKNKFK